MFYKFLILISEKIGYDVHRNFRRDELVIKYKIVHYRLFLGAESFFFEEGQDTLYQKAVYGGLKVNDKGQNLLVGLYDKDFHRIQSDK